MKKITCTNCDTSFEVSDEHYNSKTMEFNCSFCGVDIKKNTENGQWEATEKRPIPEKKNTQNSEVSTANLYKASSRSNTFISKVYLWSDRAIMLGWIVTALTLMNAIYIMVLASSCSA